MKIKMLVGVLSCLLFSASLYAGSIEEEKANLVSKSSPKNTPLINLNTADVTILSKSMKGIGIKRAEAIIKYRETHNGFKSINDLSQVPGLGKNFVNNHLEELQKVFIVQ